MRTFIHHKVLALSGQKRTWTDSHVADTTTTWISPPQFRELPLGKDDFETIIRDNAVYVDKTAHIYDLVRSPSHSAFFLSRMRRSGKSLALSTLKAVFEGKKDLFTGLRLSQTDYTFQAYPVIQLNMAKVSGKTERELRQSMNMMLSEVAQTYGIPIKTEASDIFGLAILHMDWTPEQCFSRLIRTIHMNATRKVVILIDEYDAPVLRHIENPALVEMVLQSLKSFYEVLKQSDAQIRFSFVCGVSNFVKGDMHSGLNHLDDLSRNPRFADFCGITGPELQTYFGDRIQALSTKLGQTPDQLSDRIRYWYNGYRYLPGAEKVFNPFSTISFFRNEQFKSYWFQTGTTDVLTKIMNRLPEKINPARFESQPVIEDALFNLSFPNINLAAIMFQTGYLTFLDTHIHVEQQNFTVGFPNHEVRLAFNRLLLREYSGLDHEKTTPIANSIQAHMNHGDVDGLVADFKVFFSQVPYTICPVSAVPEREAYYQSLLYVFLKTLGHRVEVEVTTNTGRIDCVFQTETRLFLLEFKLNRSSEEAMAQIKHKDYMQPYEHSDKEIHLVGINFSSDKNVRNITEHRHEIYHTREYRKLRLKEAQQHNAMGQVSEAETILLHIHQPQLTDYSQITVAMELGKRYEMSHAGFEKGLPFYQEAHAKLAQLPGPDTDERRLLTANAKRGEAYCLSKVQPTLESDEICIPMFRDAAQLFDRLPASLDKALFYSDLGQYYLNKPSPEPGIAGQHLQRAEQELEPFKSNHSRIHFFILNALGRYYFQTADYPKCLDYFSKACAVLTDELDEKNKKSFLVRQYLYLGRTHEKLGHSAEQSEMLAKATNAADMYAIDMTTFSHGVGL